MESKALRRLEKDVGKLLTRVRGALDRQTQLSSALGKNREELERLKFEIQGYKDERASTRKVVDALLRDFDKLDINWERIE